MRRSRFAFAVLLLLAAPAFGASGPTHLSLDRAVSIAIRNATNVLKAENGKELAGETLLQSYAQFLPRVDVGGTVDYNAGKTIYTFALTLVDTRNRSASLQLSAVLNLFNGLADYDAFKSALARKRASELTLDFARQQIALDISQSYLQVSLDSELIAIAKKNLEVSRARLKLLRGQEQVGAASMADLYRQEAQKSSDELLLTNAVTKERDDELVLLQKLRVDPAGEYFFETPALSASPPSFADQPVERLTVLAFSGRKDLHSLESSVDSANWGVGIARADYWPKLDLRFTGNSGGTYVFEQTVNGQGVALGPQDSLWTQLGNIVNYSVALTLTWNLFDRLSTRLGVSQARIAADNLELDYEDLRLGISSQVRQAKQNYIAAQAQVESARVGTVAAEKAVEVIEGRYRTGASSFIDLLAAQSAFVQAQSAEAQALINLKLQERAFAYTVGAMPIPE